MASSQICQRSFDFAIHIVKLCGSMNRNATARFFASQLLRCGTSIGANAEEAQEAQSKPDYISKMSISNKEAREAAWWLRLARETDILKEKEIEWPLQEVTELRYMIRAAIRTARSSTSRGHQ